MLPPTGTDNAPEIPLQPVQPETSVATDGKLPGADADFAHSLPKVTRDAKRAEVPALWNDFERVSALVLALIDEKPDGPKEAARVWLQYRRLSGQDV